MIRKKLVFLIVAGILLQIMAIAIEFWIDMPSMGILSIIGFIIWVGALLGLIGTIPEEIRSKWKNILLGGASNIFGYMGAIIVVSVIGGYLMVLVTSKMVLASDFSDLLPLIVAGDTFILLSLLLKSWKK